MVSATTSKTELGPRDLATLLAEDGSFARVSEALVAGESGTLDGLWGASKSLALAALGVSAGHNSQVKQTGPILLVVTARPADVDPLVEDLRLFAGGAPLAFPELQNLGRSSSTKTTLAEEAAGRRLAAIKAINGPTPPKIVVTNIQALLQPSPTLKHVRANTRLLKVGLRLALDQALAWLITRGWQRRDAVEFAGEFSARGGILDVFPHDSENPIRVEFFGDEIESLREFSVATQRSLRERSEVELTALGVGELLALEESESSSATQERNSLVDVIEPKAWIALLEPGEIRAEARLYEQRLDGAANLLTFDELWKRICRHPTVTLSSLPQPTYEIACSLPIESIERFSGNLANIKAELDKTLGADRALVICHNEAEAKRLAELFADSVSLRENRLSFHLGRVSRGFRWVTNHVVVVSDHELFRKEDSRPTSRRRHQSRAIDTFLDLNDGDYVVHLGHGVGVFRGMKMLDKHGQWEEHLAVEFADKVLLYVPASKIDLIQRYVGASQTAPRLSKVGGLGWERKKKIAQRAVEDLASDMLRVQASRSAQPGFACPPDSEWQRDFEDEFPFEETPDQLSAIEEIRRDLEAPRPMDRLLCGDVGYGKTELAMRAAFKIVDSGRQVAVLVPTTVLAAQHLRTFRERMSDFPYRVESVSRFQTKGEQRKVLAETAEGNVDILIGTHRLLSADVQFKDLGLVVIDEEQRFGVASKERLKALRTQVDVLTLSATPIPRTLHFALLGLRDISNLETPPVDRYAVETKVIRFDKTMIRNAALRELNRDGQMYFVHNRVQDIKSVANKLQAIVPEARIAIVHGQLNEDGIEEAMLAFVERRADILLSTTIIESGLDIPNANTMFIDDADHHGLADLHQLRGRVGRSTQRAYCYLIVDDAKLIKPEAQRRLKAIEEYSGLGSGFKIALRDLEIRGAGNILGAEQSGHIAAVGYELYCQLLDNAVRAIKKQPLNTLIDVTVELPWEAFLPHDYLPSERLRIDAYRRLARIRNLDDIAGFREDLRDRYGSIPEVGENLIDLTELRILGHLWQLEAARPGEGGALVLTYRNFSRMQTLCQLRKGEISIVDAKTAFVRVEPAAPTGRGYADLLRKLLQPS